MVIDYAECVETYTLSLEEIIDNMFDKFVNFFPPELVPYKSTNEIKASMLERINEMNKCV